MQTINSAIGALLDALLWPFQAWPLAGLTAVSLLVSLALLAAFKVTSNQRALAAAKRRMQANLFELRLFQDDPRLVMRVVGDLLRSRRCICAMRACRCSGWRCRSRFSRRTCRRATATTDCVPVTPRSSRCG